MRNNSSDALINIMRDIVKRYDAGDEDVIQTFEFDHAWTVPDGGWRQPITPWQSPGIRGEARVSYYISYKGDG